MNFKRAPGLCSNALSWKIGMMQYIKYVKPSLIVVLVLMVVKLGLTGHRVRSGLAISPAGAAASVDDASTISHDRLTIDFEAIRNANLFGLRDSDVDATGTSLAMVHGVRLIGTVTGGPAVSRAVVFYPKTQATKWLRIGDRIGSDTIETIHRDNIVLWNGLEQKTLRRSASKNSTSSQTRVSSLRPEATHHAYKITPVSLPARQSGRTLDDLLTKAVIEPRLRAGQPDGLAISSIDKVPLAKTLGLRDGDVIRRVNGQHITSRQKAFQIFRKAKQQAHLTIELERQGKSETLSFDLE